MDRQKYLSERAREIEAAETLLARKKRLIGPDERIAVGIVVVSMKDSAGLRPLNAVLPIAGSLNQTGDGMRYARPAQLSYDQIAHLLVLFKNTAAYEMRRLLVEFENNATKLVNFSEMMPQQINKIFRENATRLGVRYRLARHGHHYQLWEMEALAEDRPNVPLGYAEESFALNGHCATTRLGRMLYIRPAVLNPETVAELLKKFTGRRAYALMKELLIEHRNNPILESGRWSASITINALFRRETKPDGMRLHLVTRESKLQLWEVQVT